jgi:hypothetical protein
MKFLRLVLSPPASPALGVFTACFTCGCCYHHPLHLRLVFSLPASPAVGVITTRLNEIKNESKILPPNSIINSFF